MAEGVGAPGVEASEMLERDRATSSRLTARGDSAHGSGSADHAYMSQASVEVEAAFSDDLRGILRILRRRLWPFVVVVITVLAIGIGLLAVITPLYTATATIIIDPRKQTVTNTPEVLADVTTESSVVDTQTQLIMSRVVLGKAVDTLGLNANPEVEHGLKRLSFLRRKSDGSGPTTRNDLIDALAANLSVARVGLTSALTINFTSESPVEAQRITNAIASAYIDYQSDTKLQATREANQWLRRRVDELKANLEAAEAAVDKYRSRSGLLVAKGSTSTESQLTTLDVGLNEAQQQLSEARARLTGFRDALRTEGAAEAARVVPTPAMQQLRSQYLGLINQMAQLSPTFGPQHPQMMELNRQLEVAQEQVNAEARRTVDELSNEVRIAENKVTNISMIRDKSRQQLALDNAANVELTQKQSNAESLRQLYESMLTRLQQTTAQASLGQVNAAIVSDATLPANASSPQTGMFLIATAASALALGAFAVLLAQLVDRTIVQPREFERRTRLPVLALVPQVKSPTRRGEGPKPSAADMVVEKPMSLFAEAFRNLRVGLQRIAGGNEPLVVQFTSGAFAEGKTVCSIAFAQVAAMDGKRVLLIDGDVRRRSLSKQLGISKNVGLIELLRGEADLRDVMVYIGEAHRVLVIPLADEKLNPHDRFSAKNFEVLLQSLRSGFDLIVIDSAPVLAVAESLALARRVDAVILVVRWGRTSMEVVSKAIDEIIKVGGRIAGTLLTQVNIKKVLNQSFGRRHYSAMLGYYQQ